MKARISDLAIFGGGPLFKDKVHVGRPNIGNRQRFLERTNDLLDRRWLSNNGPYVQEFERRIAEFTGVRHCIAMCNATVALEIAIRALEMTGEVIVPSMTFIATAHALQWQEITPVFCDIEPNSYNIDPTRVEESITPRTTGIIGVHVWGRPCAIDELTEIARQKNLKLIFDAAHAFGCTYKGRMIGGFGDAEVFSFHATKVLNTLEGGAVCTNNDELATKIRLMKNFGFAGYDNVVYIGTNGKMNEISAAMGLTQMESLDEFLQANRHNYQEYRTNLASIPGVTLVSYNESERCNFHYIVVDVDKSVTGISRDLLVNVLWAENVIARRYFYPGCHQMEPYKSYFPHAWLLLPVTERQAARLLILPTGTAVGQEDVETICQLMNFIVKNASVISAKLGELAEARRA